MKAPVEKPNPDDQLIWERPEPPRRRAPSALSRERIVGAAIAIADSDGIAAVSFRSVGAALDAGPMRLYGYLSTKEELLELMIDGVYGEIATDVAKDKKWRGALRKAAHRMRRATRKHPWFIELLGSRPHHGPNALAHRESAFAVLTRSRGFEDIDVATQALRVVNAYVVGAIQCEASELLRKTVGGVSERNWHAATASYLQGMLDTGRYPNLSRVVHNAAHLSSEAVFDEGLEYVLDGIAGRLTR